MKSKTQELLEPDWGDANEKELEKPPVKKNSFAKNLFIFITYLVVVIMIALSVPRVLSWALGTPYPMAAITSQSMWPVLKRGDLVFVRKVALDDLKQGDVVVYRTEQSFIIHRVIKKGKGTITTKGDASVEADQPIEFGSIVGAVPVIRGKLVKIPYLGRIALYANKQPGN